MRYRISINNDKKDNGGISLFRASCSDFDNDITEVEEGRAQVPDANIRKI